jgi:hypothetical protein
LNTRHIKTIRRNLKYHINTNIGGPPTLISKTKATTIVGTITKRDKDYENIQNSSFWFTTTLTQQKRHYKREASKVDQITNMQNP